MSLNLRGERNPKQSDKELNINGGLFPEGFDFGLYNVICEAMKKGLDINKTIKDWNIMIKEKRGL